MSAPLHWPAGRAADGVDPVAVTPQLAGWRYAGLRVVRLAPGQRRVLDTAGRELLVLPLTGGCMVEADGSRFVLRGRAGVFAGASDFAYVPVGASAAITSAGGGEFALPWAVADTRHDPAFIPAEQVELEVRGAGRATRQIGNLFVAGNSTAQRLIVVEVLTPGGNWSSYPPHKHDDGRNPGEAVLEEIYYFRIAGAGGFGVHRTYTADRSIDVTVAVRDGDVFLVPRGYHGPCAAPPEYPMYYLNVLAGPATERSLGFTDDPAYGWIRETWRDQDTDPRVPMVRTAGVGA
jgi:5-deoxy-glucuronate isomerase